jgi:hypothetical protein
MAFSLKGGLKKVTTRRRSAKKDIAEVPTDNEVEDISEEIPAIEAEANIESLEEVDCSLTAEEAVFEENAPAEEDAKSEDIEVIEQVKSSAAGENTIEELGSVTMEEVSEDEISDVDPETAVEAVDEHLNTVTEPISAEDNFQPEMEKVAEEVALDDASAVETGQPPNANEAEPCAEPVTEAKEEVAPKEIGAVNAEGAREVTIEPAKDKEFDDVEIVIPSSEAQQELEELEVEEVALVSVLYNL